MKGTIQGLANWLDESVLKDEIRHSLNEIHSMFSWAPLKKLAKLILLFGRIWHIDTERGTWHRAFWSAINIQIPSFFRLVILLHSNTHPLFCNNCSVTKCPSSSHKGTDMEGPYPIPVLCCSLIQLAASFNINHRTTLRKRKSNQVSNKQQPSSFHPLF